MMASKSPIFAYYCSGHGFGHATRVSAVASHLLQLGTNVFIVSSAPKHVFAEAVSRGAVYRYAEIDPVIVQPLAYHVDRKKSIDVLKSFLQRVDHKTDIEVAWLKEHSVDCVLSDAAFLACKAANAAGIPSALITNFTFDSVYSYLSVGLCKSEFSTHLKSRSGFLSDVLNEEPISSNELEPLVHQLFQGYRCADLLVRLPGHIPIPSFSTHPSLPSHYWTDVDLGSFYATISDSLIRDISSEVLHAQIPFSTAHFRQKPLKRRMMQGPLVVREPSPDVFLPRGRERILTAAGVPTDLQGPEIKVLVVSFGGQLFRRPGSNIACTPVHMRTPVNSRTSSIESLLSLAADSDVEASSASSGEDFVHAAASFVSHSRFYEPKSPSTIKTIPSYDVDLRPDEYSCNCKEIAIDRCLAKIWPESVFSQYLSLPDACQNADLKPRFLPDLSWIAIVCGASPSASDSEELPLSFFLAPRDVHMPDLTAIADVVLGKLGYGTVSECIAARTPLVYVPRPLFIEEHGLRRLLLKGDKLETSTVIDFEPVRDAISDSDPAGGVEMPQESYEAGNWGPYIARAYAIGRGPKQRRQERGFAEDVVRRAAASRMAQNIINWVHEWQLAEQNADIKAVFSTQE